GADAACSGATEKAMQAAKNTDTATAVTRAHHGRTSAGAIASTTSTNGRPPPERGSSNRSQSTAMTSAAIPDSATVLSTCDLRDRRRLERGGEIVARTHGRNRYAGRVQPQQQRLRPPPRAVEACRVDVHQGHLSVRRRALDEPVDERRLEPSGHDRELECA